MKRQGFTLVEAMLAVGMITVLVMVAADFLTDTLRAMQRVNHLTESERAGQLILTNLATSAPTTRSVDEGRSRFGVANGALSLLQGDGQAIRWSVEGGVLWEDSAGQRKRLSGDAVVESFTLTPVVYEGSTEGGGEEEDEEEDVAGPPVVRSVVVDMTLRDARVDPSSGVAARQQLHFAVTVGHYED